MSFKIYRISSSSSFLLFVLFAQQIFTSSTVPSSSISVPSINSTLQLECDFSIKSIPLWNTKEIYTCSIPRGLNLSQPNVKISQIKGDHLRNKEDQNVHAFQVVDKIFNFFPRDLENFFYRLAVITIENSALLEIHQKDLSPFTNLKVLQLPANNLTILERDIFHYNLKLEVIVLSGNKIKNVHPDVFDYLDSLKLLNFNENFCISGNESDRMGVKSLITKVKEKCGNFDFQQFEQLIELKNSSKLQIGELKRENLVLKTLNFETSQKIENLTKLIDELKGKLEAKNSNLTSILLTTLLALLTVLSIVIVGAVVMLVINQKKDESDAENEKAKIEASVMKLPTLRYNYSMAENIYEDVRPGRNETVYDRLNHF